MNIEINNTFLSTKNIPIRERLIFALDVPSVEEAKALVKTLGDSVQFYKLGLELFMAGGYFELVKWLGNKGKKVFVDLKFFDVPRTVASAIKQLQKHNAQFATVHGNENILKAAVDEKNGIKILAVTVLTSLDDDDMRDLGFKSSIPSVVLSRAKRAIQIGCDGVISSGMESSRLRENLGDRFLVVCPGIRPGSNNEIASVTQDDQKRKTTVENAFRDGADYIVVGRPIYLAEDPKEAAERIQETIISVFRARK